MISMSPVRKVFWHVVTRGCGGLLDALEVRLERVHARDREQRRGVVLGRDQRRRGQAQVVAGPRRTRGTCGGSRQKSWTPECRRGPVPMDAVRTRVSPPGASIVPHPTTSSPSIRQASWPGAAPSTGSASSSSSVRWRPAAGVARDAGARAALAVAQLDAVDAASRRGAGARARTATWCGAQRGAGADGDASGVGVLVEHVQRLGRSDAEPAALADREAVLAVVAAEDGAAAGRRSPRAARRVRRGGPGTGRGSVPARKHRSWESALAATGSPASAAIRADLGLAQLAEREAHPRQRGRAERGQHVGLVLGRVGGRAQQRPRASSGSAVRA